MEVNIFGPTPLTREEYEVIWTVVTWAGLVALLIAVSLAKSDKVKPWIRKYVSSGLAVAGTVAIILGLIYQYLIGPIHGGY